MEGLSLRQRDIYDGRDGGQLAPVYVDPDAWNRSIAFEMDIAGKYGLLVSNWKGMKSREVMDGLEPRAGELLLDIGCGAGMMLNTMHIVYGTRGVGIDISPVALRAAAACNPCGNLYLLADALALPFRDCVFDLACSFDAVEHVPDPGVFVAEMARVVRPGGRMLIYTPSRRSRWPWHWWQQVLTGGKQGRDVLAGHDPERFLAPDELEGLMRENGLAWVKTVSFHTLYTLIFDEIYPGFIHRLLDRPRLCRAVFRALQLADAAPNDRGYGNGFFAYGWKIQEGEG